MGPIRPERIAATRWATLLLLLISPACARPSSDTSLPHQAAQQALRHGALDEALSHIERGMTAAGTDPDAPAVHELRLLHAEILLAKPDLAGAAALVAIPIPDRAEYATLQPRHRYVRARLELARGEVKEALATLQSIEELDLHQPDVHLDAEVLAGQALLRLGRWDEGETRLRAILDEAQRRGDRYRQLLALNNLGMRFVNQRRFDEALPWFSRLQSFTDLEQTSVYAASLNNAGLSYARLGNFDRALEFQHRAVALQERRGTAGPYEQALGELGHGRS